jgi:hypothetical protein
MTILRKYGAGLLLNGASLLVDFGIAATQAAPGNKLPGPVPIDTTSPIDGYVLAYNAGLAKAVWSAAGTGDMLLAGVQTVTGAKTFNTDKLIANGINTPAAVDFTVNIGPQGGNQAMQVWKINGTEFARLKNTAGLSLGLAESFDAPGLLLPNGRGIWTKALNATQKCMLYASGDDVLIQALSVNGAVIATFGTQLTVRNISLNPRLEVSNTAMTTTNLYQEMGAIADPGVSAASTGRLYWKLNGGGKMELKAIGPTGAASVLFTEP